MRLHTDITDNYIEKIEQYNHCGDKIDEIFYLRVARYNLFGKKRYIRLRQYCSGYGDGYYITKSFKSKRTN